MEKWKWLSRAAGPVDCIDSSALRCSRLCDAGFVEQSQSISFAGYRRAILILQYFILCLSWQSR